MSFSLLFCRELVRRPIIRVCYLHLYLYMSAFSTIEAALQQYTMRVRAPSVQHHHHRSTHTQLLLLLFYFMYTKMKQTKLQLELELEQEQEQGTRQ